MTLPGIETWSPGPLANTLPSHHLQRIIIIRYLKLVICIKIDLALNNIQRLI